MLRKPVISVRHIQPTHSNPVFITSTLGVHAFYAEDSMEVYSLHFYKQTFVCIFPTHDPPISLSFIPSYELYSVKSTNYVAHYKTILSNTDIYSLKLCIHFQFSSVRLTHRIQHYMFQS
jgi:hypothetical protein